MRAPCVTLGVSGVVSRNVNSRLITYCTPLAHTNRKRVHARCRAAEASHMPGSQRAPAMQLGHLGGPHVGTPRKREKSGVFAARCTTTLRPLDLGKGTSAGATPRMARSQIAPPPEDHRLNPAGRCNIVHGGVTAGKSWSCQDLRKDVSKAVRRGRRPGGHARQAHLLQVERDQLEGNRELLAEQLLVVRRRHRV